MLISIGRRPEATPDDPVSHLLACHQRIRHFTAMALALGEASGAASDEVGAAAAAVLRYFTVALPLHSADEDASVAPRLLAGAPPAPLREALAAMTAQHAGLEATLAALVLRWRAVAADPGCLPAHADELCRLATRLSEQWDEHLGLEEATVFPEIAARLSDEQRAAVRAEMRARRAEHEAAPGLSR